MPLPGLSLGGSEGVPFNDGQTAVACLTRREGGALLLPLRLFVWAHKAWKEALSSVCKDMFLLRRTTESLCWTAKRLTHVVWTRWLHTLVYLGLKNSGLEPPETGRLTWHGCTSWVSKTLYSNNSIYFLLKLVIVVCYQQRHSSCKL